LLAAAMKDVRDLILPDARQQSEGSWSMNN
jgi:hypothetical protein